MSEFARKRCMNEEIDDGDGQGINSCRVIEWLVPMDGQKLSRNSDTIEKYTSKNGGVFSVIG